MATTVNVFISSPNDVQKERDICCSVINSVNTYVEANFGIRFNACRYEDLLPAGEEPQPYIDRELPMEKMDIFIAILWCRMGTPFDNYISGTDKELHDAIEANRKYKKPKIMLFHKTARPYRNYDRKQKELVDEYISNFRFFKQTYDDVSIFQNFVTKALMEYAFSLHNEQQKMDLTANLHAKLFGVDRIYFQTDGVSRDEDKKQAMENSTHIDLLAHAGYSYLVEQAEKLYLNLKHSLDNNCEVRIILTNPYSESGFLITLADENDTELNRSFLELRSSQKSKNKIFAQINKADWITIKFFNALKGYKKLKDEYPNNINLRLLPYEMAASILITDSCCFIEPYIVIKRSERGMTTYEIKVNPEIDESVRSKDKQTLFQNYSTYFDFLWDIADPYEEVKSSIDANKKY